MKKRGSKISSRKKNKLNKKIVHKYKTKSQIKKPATLKLLKEHDIAIDFATKVYEKFDTFLKAAILFGSAAKKQTTPSSDIDIIFIIDDVSIKWDTELIAWYREELGKLIEKNPYQYELHINTLKLSTWWEDILKGDPIVLNILRNGTPLIDFAGFFTPLKYLLLNGKIRPSPEAIYTSLSRAPVHLANSKRAELNAVEGIYWAMVDSAHAALISTNYFPVSPEHIYTALKEHLVNANLLKPKYAEWFREIFFLHKQISRNKVTELKGVQIDDWQDKADEFINIMAQVVQSLFK